MRCILPIVFTLMLTIGQKTACFGQSSDSICISYAERDTIYKRLNECRVLPELREMVKAQNAQLGAWEKLSKNDRATIDSLKSRVQTYDALLVVKNEHEAVLNDIIKLKTKKIRRTKLMTTTITIPISVLFGGVMGLIIAK